MAMNSHFPEEAQTPLAGQIAQQLRDQHGIEIAAEENAGALYLSGRVPTQHDKAQAHALAQQLAGEKKVVDMLMVEEVLPDDFPEGAQEDLTEANRTETPYGTLDVEDNLNPLFTGQPLVTDQEMASDSVENGALDLPDATREDFDMVYFPPTDPVFGVDASGNLDVLNGFAPTSMSGARVESSAEDTLPGDEALAGAVLAQLSRDALTTDLTIDVAVERGVVRLRGRVPTPEDAEQAASVASEVQGVREVLEELTIEQG